MPKLLVALAAHNEEEGLQMVLPGIPATLDGVEFTALVVDDHSTDQTAEVAISLGCRVLPNSSRGYGAARRLSMQVALEEGYDYLLTMDSDGQHDPALIPHFLSGLIEGYHFVIGDRLSVTEEKDLPPGWKALYEMVNQPIRQITGWPLGDALCGMRASPCFLLREVFPRLKMDDYGHAIEFILHFKDIYPQALVKQVSHPPLYRGTKRLAEKYSLESLKPRVHRFYEHLAHIREVLIEQGRAQLADQLGLILCRSSD